MNKDVVILRNNRNVVSGVISGESQKAFIAYEEKYGWCLEESYGDNWTPLGVFPSKEDALNHL